MKLFFYSLFVFSVHFLSAQSTWTKTDRNNLYQDVLADLDRYRLLSDGQKESIGLCCLETVTSKYTKESYKSKIEIEIQRIKSSTIDQCSKNIGIDLKAAQKSEQENSSSTEEWTKEDKSSLVKASISHMEDFNISEHDKEVIALCFIDETSTSMSKTDFDNMIRLELDRYTKSMIDKCAGKNNIDLNESATNKSGFESFNKSFLLGTWNTDQGFTITFNEDGTFLKTFKTNFYVAHRYTKVENSTVTGNWFIDELGNLTLNEEWVELEYKLFKTNRISYSGTSAYSFISNTEDFFKIRFTNGKYCCRKTNDKPLQIIQANRSK